MVGFGYDYWFTCVDCGGRVRIDAELYELQCCGRAEPSVCASCSTEVDVTQQSPTLRDPADPAAQPDGVDGFFWYHSGRYENWPDQEAYAAEIAAQAAQTAERFDCFDAESWSTRKLTLALHLGTYEAAIENILRRAISRVM